MMIWVLSASSSAFPPFPEGHPAVLPGEDPPPYSPLTSPDSGSAPMITCRVCQSPINVEGKMHQHVVKCGVCNEATVSCNALQDGPGFLDALSGFRPCCRTHHETHFQFLDLQQPSLQKPFAKNNAHQLSLVPPRWILQCISHWQLL